MAGCGLAYFAYWIDNFTVTGFDFRDIVRKSQIPFMRVFLSLALAWLAYLLMQRGYWLLMQIGERLGWNARINRKASERVLWTGKTVTNLAALICAVGSSLPLWYWDVRQISMNTYARCVEHSVRHEFELLVLHGLFDADFDGYSALLHGGDVNDFDSTVTATGFPPYVPVDLPIDEFEVVDSERAENFPNVLLLTLEGVTPEAISAYGQRRLEEGRIATPNIDRVASEGTIFTNGRSAYPSTWDAWLMINTGRYIRVTEMDNILSFEDRYSRHNNINKVARAAGVTRWCHSNALAYSQMMVGPERWDHWENEWWEPLTGEEEGLGMTIGDKNMTRVQRFIDDLDGEKFFISEHMADSHFPWYRVTDTQAEKMGYPEGLGWVEVDSMDYDDDHAAYYQEITRVDWQIGEMLKMLDEKGLYDNTLIIIVGDHGCQWWEHGHKYYPGHLYDPALQIPMIIRHPDIDGGGEMVDVPVLQMDILPTMAELAGVAHSNPEETSAFPGCSLVPFLRGESTAADWEQCSNRDMLLTTHYDMVGFIDNFQHKLIVDRLTGTYFLYDLVSDPGEKNNLADSHPELFEAMLDGLRDMNLQYPEYFAGVER